MALTTHCAVLTSAVKLRTGLTLIVFARRLINQKSGGLMREKTRIGTISYAEAWYNDVQSYTWVKKRALEIELEEKFKSWKTSR